MPNNRRLGVLNPNIKHLESQIFNISVNRVQVPNNRRLGVLNPNIKHLESQIFNISVNR